MNIKIVDIIISIPVMTLSFLIALLLFKFNLNTSLTISILCFWFDLKMNIQKDQIAELKDELSKLSKK